MGKMWPSDEKEEKSPDELPTLGPSLKAKLKLSELTLPGVDVTVDAAAAAAAANRWFQMMKAFGSSGAWWWFEAFVTGVSIFVV